MIKEKLISMILALCVLIAIIPSASATTVASGVCGDTLDWELDDMGTLTITGTGVLWGYKPPWREYCNDIKRVILPDGITSIGWWAFVDCNNLTCINMPNTITKIDYGAFEGCRSLETINIPDGVTEIGGNAFDGCSSLKSISIPNGVTRIKRFTFYDCESLEYVSIPDSITDIEDFAFYNCRSLKTVTIPDGITVIASSMFGGSSGLESIVLPRSINHIGDAFGFRILKDIYYEGSEEEWTNVELKTERFIGPNTIIHYNYNGNQNKIIESIDEFADVYTSDYYKDAVIWAKEFGVTQGIGNGLFGPELTVTRAQAVTFLWRTAGNEEPQSTISPFLDVTDESAWYYKAVMWAYEHGITNGVSTTEFGIDFPVNYDQMLAFIARYSKADISDDWSNKAIKWAADQGITNAISFSGPTSCPRKDVVLFLQAIA